MSEKQTYSNYFREYFKSPEGRRARLKAQSKWRAKLRQLKLKEAENVSKEELKK